MRYDQNTPPLPLPSTRPGAIAGALAGINGYPPGGYVELRRAIADYTGVEPEQIVLGVGADDLILLCARVLRRAGRHDRDPGARRRIRSTGSRRSSRAPRSGDDDPVLTFACRPNSPTGELRPLPDGAAARRRRGVLRVLRRDRVPLLDDGDVIVLRTFSKAFALAGARIGYALASRELAAELNARQAPAPVSTSRGRARGRRARLAARRARR